MLKYLLIQLVALLASSSAMSTTSIKTTSTKTATTSSFSTPKTSTYTSFTTLTPAKVPVYYTVTAIPSTSTVVTATVANINTGTGKFDLFFLQTNTDSTATHGASKTTSKAITTSEVAATSKATTTSIASAASVSLAISSTSSVVPYTGRRRWF